MRSILAFIVSTIGIIGGIYVGLYVMLIKGIIQLVQSITPEVIASGIAIGIVRILFASFVGWLIVWTGFILAGIIKL